MRRTEHRLWIWVPLLCLSICLAGVIYQYLSLSFERHRYPMPGRLVKVGDGYMHLYCIGTGSPTIVLDSGLGDSFVEWAKVQRDLSTFDRVCSYDRAGMGYSDPTNGPRNSLAFASELHALLHNAEVRSPYLLVGHSMAAFDIRMYQANYPSDVIGLVFVDGSHPEQLQRLPPEMHVMDPQWIRQGRLWEFLTPLGVARLRGICGDDPEVRAVECTFNDARENAEERTSFRQSAEQAELAPTKLKIPVLVVSHDPNKDADDLSPEVKLRYAVAWTAMQNELAALSQKSTHLVAKGSGHYIQTESPDLLVSSIHSFIEGAVVHSNKH